MRLRMAALVCALAIVSVRAAGAEDTGKVILAISAGPDANYQQYVLHFRSTDGEHSDYATYFQHNWLLAGKPDFSDAGETGVVKVLSLPPGAWEIYTIELVEFGGTLTPNREFSIPFTVRAGETVYIGDYKAVSAGASVDYWEHQAQGVYYVVTDKSARDVPIAKMADKSISDVAAAVPDVNKAGTPLFRRALGAVPVTGGAP